MRTHHKLFLAITACGLFGTAGAQTTGRTVEEASRDTANSVGRAASAAVTPGDQNMGRTPDNRSGGLMGSDRTGTGSTTSAVGRAASAAVTPGDQNMGRNPDNRSGGMMGSGTSAGDTTLPRSSRASRADRG